MSPMLKNILIAGGLISIAVVAYMFLFGNDSDTSSVSQVQEVSPEVVEKTQLFVARLEELRTIQLDREILNDPRFTALQDFRQPIEDEATGRTNPFDPSL